MRRIALVAAFGFALGLSSSVFAAGPVTRQLDQRLPELKFQGVSFGDAVDFLRDVSGANINVNWKALEGANVGKDAPLNIHLRQISLRKALDVILSEAGGGDSLTFDVDDGVIEITTRELADRRMITKVYPIEDLIMEIPDFIGPTLDLQSTTQGVGGGNGGGSGGGAGGGIGGVVGIPFREDTDKGKETKTKTERAQDLIALIQNVVSTDVWKENGGTASISYYNGNLVVTAPRSVQEALGGAWE